MNSYKNCWRVFNEFVSGLSTIKTWWLCTNSLEIPSISWFSRILLLSDKILTRKGDDSKKISRGWLKVKTQKIRSNLAKIHKIRVKSAYLQGFLVKIRVNIYQLENWRKIFWKYRSTKIRMLPQKGFYQIVWGIQYGVLYVVSESYLPSASSNHRFPSEFKLSNLEASAARLTFCWVRNCYQQ